MTDRVHYLDLNEGRRLKVITNYGPASKWAELFEVDGDVVRFIGTSPWENFTAMTLGCLRINTEAA